MHSKGTMALVFACTVPQARLAGKFFGEDAIAAIAAIFDGSENPDPCAVTAALEPDAASARAYLVVMNGKVGFTLLLQLCNCIFMVNPAMFNANLLLFAGVGGGVVFRCRCSSCCL